jgi:threonine/homoserine/homoserine lactone efflux protein
VIVTPGQDTALTIRNTLAGGRRSGVFTALGVASGQAIWTVAAAAGIAAVLSASEPLFLAVKLGGAAYLVFLGTQMVAQALRGQRHGVAATVRRVSARGSFSQGLISNLGNPKMAVFFTSLLPQFGGASFGALAGLGLVFCTMTFLWLSVYAAAVARAADVLQRSRLRRTLDAATGTVLVALGIRVATETRA